MLCLHETIVSACHFDDEAVTENTSICAAVIELVLKVGSMEAGDLRKGCAHQWGNEGQAHN